MQLVALALSLATFLAPTASFPAYESDGWSSDTGFRLAYSTFHEPLNTEIRTAKGDTAPGHEEHVDILVGLNGGERARCGSAGPSPQLQRERPGPTARSARTAPWCTPMGETGGWELNTTDVPNHGPVSGKPRVAAKGGGARWWRWVC